MIQDLHSHTYYSFCSQDSPESTIDAAVAGGVKVFGISDHAHGVGHGKWEVYAAAKDGAFADYGKTLVRYHDHIQLLKQKYAGKINVLSGIEINTDKNTPQAALPLGVDVSFFEYCLVEHLDSENSLTEGDIFAFAKRCGCVATGIAHTDLFLHIAKRGEHPLDYFKRMAEQNIFWEMNVSCDSIHQYREHAYVTRFLQDETQQEVVRQSGVRLSVGFDGHRVAEYAPERVVSCCNALKTLGIPLIFE